jgi:hypothetical protein
MKGFELLFDTLRGSRDKYFTPTDRTLLTYELLSRVNSDDYAAENVDTHISEGMINLL